MRTTTRIVATATTALLALTTLAACGSGDDDPAATDTKVVFYTDQTPGVAAALETAFEDAHPEIDVEVVRMLTNDLQARIAADAQARAAGADVVVSTDYAWTQAQAEADAWVTPTGEELDGEAGGAVADGGYVDIGAAVLIVGWNTSQVPAGLEGYADLLDPSLSGGKIGVMEPSVAALTAYYQWLEAEMGTDFLEDLAAQQPTIYAGAQQLMGGLVAGEIAATPYAAPSILAGEKENGAPVDYTTSPEGAWGVRYWAGILASGENQDAAQLFTSFLLSPEGQGISSQNAASYLTDIEGTITSSTTLPDPEVLTPDDVAAYLVRWNELFR